jgi:carbonic anhydrase
MISGGPLDSSYELIAIHLHWGENNMVGSEHQFNGHSLPMELHVVTRNTKYG